MNRIRLKARGGVNEKENRHDASTFCRARSAVRSAVFSHCISTIYILQYSSSIQCSTALWGGRD
jgi:hypothetical protein